MAENKHQAYDLAQMQSLPLSAKVRMTQQRIRDWYEYWDGNVYVSRSGGKDSDVLGHIVKEMYPDVPQVFVNTGLEFDSVRLHAMEECDTVLRPEKSFFEILSQIGYPIIGKKQAETVERAKKNIFEKKYTFAVKSLGIKEDEAVVMGLKLPEKEMLERYKKTYENSKYKYEKYRFLLDAPFRISAKCCDCMKKKPAFLYQKEHKSLPYLGTMASESMMRKAAWMNHGCNAFTANHPSSQPLSFWTEQDILQYIKLNDIEIAKAYGEIVYKDSDGMQYDNEIFNCSKPLETTGESRTGCVFCLFGITQDTDRLVRLKSLEPKKIRLCNARWKV